MKLNITFQGGENTTLKDINILKEQILSIIKKNFKIILINSNQVLFEFEWIYLSENQKKQFKQYHDKILKIEDTEFLKFLSLNFIERKE